MVGISWEWTFNDDDWWLKVDFVSSFGILCRWRDSECEMESEFFFHIFLDGLEKNSQGHALRESREVNLWKRERKRDCERYCYQW